VTLYCYRFAEQSQRRSGDNDDASFVSDDSLTELCSNFTDLRVDDNNRSKTSDQPATVGETKSIPEWWSSTPVRQTFSSAKKDVRTSKERHLKLLREQLLQTRRNQLSKLTEGFNSRTAGVDRSSLTHSSDSPPTRLSSEADFENFVARDEGIVYDGERKFSQR